MLMIRGAASLLLVIHLLLCVHSIDQGTVIKAHPDAPSAIVAIWSDGSSGAAPVRCTGVFVAPEVVLTAASCILRATPTGLVQHAACAHGARDCPTLAPAAIKVLTAASLPERVVVADVTAIEFRYSDPSQMPQICTGGAVCGRGWNIAVLRVLQRCPEQRCTPPLAISTRGLVEGDAVRIVGAGVDASGRWALRSRAAAISHVGELQVILSHSEPQRALPAPVACEGDTGAPLLVYEAGYDEGYETGYEAGWAVAGVLSRAAPAGQCGTPAPARAAPGSRDGDGRAWSVHVSRCWLWQALVRWGGTTLAVAPGVARHTQARGRRSLAVLNGSNHSGVTMPPAPPPAPPPSPQHEEASQATAQWAQRAEVRSAAEAAAAECGGSDHWPPELLPASAALPARYAALLAAADVEPIDISGTKPRAEACYPSATHFCIHLVSERGRLRYSVDSGRGALPALSLYLVRLVSYTFQMVGVHAAHPLLISSSSTGPDVRDARGVSGTHPASGHSFFVFTPSAETPSRLWYQSATQAGLGGPIFVDFTPADEPKTLPGGDGAYAPHPHALLVWEAERGTLSRWRWSDDGHKALGAAEEFDLAAAAFTSLYNASLATYEEAFAAAMRAAPQPPQRPNGTNGTNETNVNASREFNASMEAYLVIRADFEALLPTMQQVVPQTVLAVKAWPLTGEVLWSTRSGGVFAAQMQARDDGDDGGNGGGGGDYSSGGGVGGVGGGGGLALTEVRVVRDVDEVRVDGARVAGGVPVAVRALHAQHDLRMALFLDADASTAIPLPRLLDLSSGAISNLLTLSFVNGTGHAGDPGDTNTWPGDSAATRWPGIDTRTGQVASRQWFDEDSPLDVDWRARRLFWCQPSARRILTAHMDGGPVLTLVEHTVCPSLAVDPNPNPNPSPSP
jgi:hypothetical protein